MGLKVASWNVNSIRVRMPHVVDWLQAHQPDVLALQETKVQDFEFPLSEIEDIGYTVVFVGQKSYNGVAIIYKKHLTIDAVTMALPQFEDQEKRFIAATIAGVRIVNVYVPNGRAVDHEAYQYKLKYLEGLKNYLHQQLKENDHVLVMGDFNIAPADIDVHDPDVWEGQVLVSPAERLALSAIIDLGFHDSFREINSNDNKIFSWWPYKGFAFRRKRGLRIDLILLSDALQGICSAVGVDSIPRGWERPSDHTPVWAVCDVV